MFCYMESVDSITASHEHLLSKPVAAAFGIDRTSPVARIDAADKSKIRWRPINGIKQRVVCTKCNNGWMNRLEHRMARVAEWSTGRPDERLGEERERDLRCWAMKTHMLLCYIDGNADHFGDDAFDQECVVPPVTPARGLYEGDVESLRRAAVGLAKSASRADFAWSFGFPTVKAKEPGAARFAPATVLTLGSLQIWVVTPLLDASVGAPVEVISSDPSVRVRDLSELGHPLTVEEVVVEFE